MNKIPPANSIAVADSNSHTPKSNITLALERFFKTGESKRLAQALHNQGIKAIAFDMDGTLAATEAINLQIVEDGLKEHGVKLSDEEKEEYIGTTIKSFSQMILERREIDDAENKAIAISNSKDTKFPEMLEAGKIQVFDKVINLVKALDKENFGLALVTSSKGKIMEQVLKHFNLSNYFGSKLGREDANRQLKPDPYIYNKAKNQLGFQSEPQKVLVFEDSAPGIKSAHSAGCNVVVIKNLETQNPTAIPNDSRIHRLDMTQFAN